MNLIRAQTGEDVGLKFSNLKHILRMSVIVSKQHLVEEQL
jgi:hypothetical protein